MQRVTIRVKGKVQGVFFRKHTFNTAVKLGVNGFVRNEKDGSVYIEAEGDAQSLKDLTDWCRTGPERAVVENLEVEVSDAIKGFGNFDIRY